MTKTTKTKNSANSANGSGNTKQIHCSRNWCFTLYNYTEKDIKKLLDLSSAIVPYFVFQEEKCPKTGKEHLQGWLSFKTKKRPFSVFKAFGKPWSTAHFEKAHAGWRKNREYCSKEASRNGKTYYRGIEPPYQIKIRHWQPWMYKVLAIVDKEPDERKIHWIWEPNGNRGKTIFSKWLFLNKERVVILSGKAHDMKNTIVNYIEKNHMHPRTVLMNIPRSKTGFVSYTGLEEIKDMFFYSGKYEGGQVCGPNPHVIVMANAEPEYEKMSDDRWEVINI